MNKYLILYDKGNGTGLTFVYSVVANTAKDALYKYIALSKVEEYDITYWQKRLERGRKVYDTWWFSVEDSFEVNDVSGETMIAVNVLQLLTAIVNMIQ